MSSSNGEHARETNGEHGPETNGDQARETAVLSYPGGEYEMPVAQIEADLSEFCRSLIERGLLQVDPA